jgi:hypothetical protein
MHKLLQVGTLGVAGLTTTGLIAFTAPAALAGDDQGNAVYKREHDSSVLTTADDGDDNSGPGGGDDTSTGADNTDADTGTGAGTSTNTNTQSQAGTETGTRTRGGDTDHSREGHVKDITNDGAGSGNVDHSRGHTNDGSRHNTRG